MLNLASPTSASCLDPTPENLCFPPMRGDYIYFETPPFQPGEPATVSLSRAADASMLAYARFVQRRMVLADLQEILATAGYPSVQPIGDCFVDGANTGRGYFASNDSHALLAFRGTEADNNYDKLADGEIDRTLEAGALVHSGFKRYLDLIWPQVMQCVAAYRANHPNQNICITGHSLGGALATLAFTRLNDPASTLITLGCPRVGNSTYCNVVDAAARTRACYRVVDDLDIVTHVPPDFLNFYTHPTVAILLAGPGSRVAVQPTQLTQRQRCHCPTPRRIPDNTLDGGPSQPAVQAIGGPLASSLCAVSWEVHISGPRQPGTNVERADPSRKLAVESCD